MATMTQAQIEDWISKNGGAGAVQYGTDQRQIRNPTYNAAKGPTPSNPEFLTVQFETWTNTKTGAKLSGRRGDSGDFDDVETTSADPNKPAASASTNVATNTTEPYIVSRNPDGSLRQEPNPNYRPPATDVAKPPTEKDEGGHRYVWHPNPGGPSAGGKWEDMGPNTAPETPAERQAREANAPSQSVATKEVGGKVYTVITIVPKPGQPGEPGQVVLGPDGKVAPNGIPGEGPKDTPKTVTGPDGKTYIQHTVQHPDGSSELYHTDQSGKRVTLPSEGDVTASGPPMPHFVASSAMQALTDYHDALSKSGLPIATQNKLFQEADQIAQLVVQQAATEQRERESERNTAYNVASSKLTYQQNGMNQALDFVSKLNGTLPIGSNLGGQAFAALMGMQMLQMAGSGIDNLPKVTASDLTTPQGVQTARAQVTPALQAATSPAPAPPAQNAGAGTGEPPARGAVPTAARPAATAAPVAPAPVAPAVPSSTLPPNRPDQTQAAPQIENAISPPQAPAQSGTVTVRHKPTGAETTVTRAEWEAFRSDPTFGDWEEIPSYAPPSTTVTQGTGIAPNPPAYGKPGADPNFTSVPQQNPGGGTVLPAPDPSMPVNVPYPTSPALESAAPQGQPDFAVLADVPRMATPAPVQPQPAAPATDYPAMLHTQAAIKPVWMMSEDEVNRYRAAGVPDDVIFSTPQIGSAA